MSNLITRPKNPFLRFTAWLKLKLFNKKNKLHENSNLKSNELNNKDDLNEIIDEKYVYVQDLDYETEKKNMIDLYKDVITKKKKIEDLDLADMVRIKLLLGK